MIQKLGILLGLVLTSLFSFSQTFSDVFNLKNYQKSVILSIGKNEQTQLIFSEYGSISHSLNTPNNNNKYSFQSQEYDAILDMYFYPTRMYNATNRRFFQPDPKSQYHSPYLFIGADPINFIDLDGNVGKPLILYYENRDLPGISEVSLADLQTQVGDAYYYPISDVLNQNIGDMSEWNGNIFIKGHMGIEAGNEMQVESASSEKLLKANPELTQRFEENGKFSVGLDGKQMGKSLRILAEEKNVPVRNIVAGGCHGSAAAEAIGKGYTEQGGKLKGGKLKTAGLKRGRKALISGKKEILSRKDAPLVSDVQETSFYAKPAEYSVTRKTEKDPRGRKVFKKYRGRDPQGKVHDLNYAQGGELNDLANGRIPPSLASEFEEFHFMY